MIVKSQIIQYYNGILEFDSTVWESFERMVTALKCEDKTLDLTVWEKNEAGMREKKK